MQVAHVRFSGDATADGPEAFTGAEAEALERLVQNFLLWQSVAPTTPKALAELLAPLCRMVRDDVAGALQDPGSSLSQLAHDWRETLFPDADDARFADAYAQTLTYALLAKFSGADQVRPESAAEVLESGHGLLAQTLRLLGNPDARRDVGVGLDVLVRAVSAVDPAALHGEGDDPWLYFYKDFLAAYDRRLRNRLRRLLHARARDSGAGAARLGVARDSLSKLAYTADEVVVLDPAAGTGAYPLAVLQHALERVANFYGPGTRASYASKLARNVRALKFLVGPYAVAHLRVTQKVMEEKAASCPPTAFTCIWPTPSSPPKRETWSSTA